MFQSLQSRLCQALQPFEQSASQSAFCCFLSLFIVGVCGSPSLALAEHQSHQLTREEWSAQLKSYAGLVSLRAKFKEKKWLEKLRVELESEGEFRYSRNAESIEVHWDIEKPSQVHMVIRPSGIEIDAGHGELKIPQPPEHSKAWKGLIAWLTVDERQLFEDHIVTTEKPRDFRLVPKNSRLSPFSEIKLVMSPTGTMERLDLQEKTGDRITLLFSQTTLKVQP